MGKNNTPIAPGLIEDIKTYYQDNHSYCECEKKFGVSRATISRYMRKSGILRSFKDAIALRESKKEHGSCWKGGRSLGYKPGYISIYTGVKNGVSTYRLEHLLIAEAALGRALKRGEVVHHLNGDGLDNRNCNLMICTNSYHAAFHQKMAKLYQREHFT